MDGNFPSSPGSVLLSVTLSKLDKTYNFIMVLSKYVWTLWALPSNICTFVAILFKV